MLKCIAIVQARNSSTRFPKKMEHKIGGFKIIEWVLRRLKKANLVDKIILATSDQPENLSLVDAAAKLGIDVVIGDEDDVYSRYLRVLKEYPSESFVRVCADNPFICWELVDHLINDYQANNWDYACNHQDFNGSGFVDGLGAEIIKTSAFLDLEKHHLTALEREHVTIGLKKRYSEFNIGHVKAKPPYNRPEIKLDIDNEKDAETLKSIVLSGANIEDRGLDILKHYDMLFSQL